MPAGGAHATGRLSRDARKALRPRRQDRGAPPAHGLALGAPPAPARAGAPGVGLGEARRQGPRAPPVLHRPDRPAVARQARAEARPAAQVAGPPQRGEGAARRAPALVRRLGPPDPRALVPVALEAPPRPPGLAAPAVAPPARGGAGGARRTRSRAEGEPAARAGRRRARPPPHRTRGVGRRQAAHVGRALGLRLAAAVRVQAGRRGRQRQVLRGAAGRQQDPVQDGTLEDQCVVRASPT